MSEPVKKIILLRPDALPADKMIVMLTVGELRQLISEVLDQKLKRVSPAQSSLLNAEQAAEYLGYSKEWVYRKLAKNRRQENR